MKIIISAKRKPLQLEKQSSNCKYAKTLVTRLQTAQNTSLTEDYKKAFIHQS